MMPCPTFSDTELDSDGCVMVREDPVMAVPLPIR